MQRVTIYGSSDDLVEVEGDLSEEFSGQDVTLVFGDGTKVRAFYHRDGVWKVSLESGPAKQVEYQPATDADDENYSDRLTLEGELVSVDKVYSAEEMRDALVDADWAEVPDAPLGEVFALAKKHGAI
jgi:hypothetical protein